MKFKLNPYKCTEKCYTQLLIPKNSCGKLILIQFIFFLLLLYSLENFLGRENRTGIDIKRYCM
jgi:hypothetical protein